MARICRTCGANRHRHRQRFNGFGWERLCPVRPLNRAERMQRGLTMKPRPEGEPARFIVDHSLLEEQS
jgi:hypothetical protein